MYTGEYSQWICKCAGSEKFGDHNDIILFTLHCICLSLLRPPLRKLIKEGMLYSVALSKGGRGAGFKWYIKEGHPKTLTPALFNPNSHRRQSKPAVSMSVFWHCWVTLASFPFWKTTQALGLAQARGKGLLCSQNPTSRLYFHCPLLSVASNVGSSLLACFCANFLKCI